MHAPLQARNDSDAAKTDTARTVAQKRVLADNRPEAVAQRKLADMMNSSPRVLQQLALSDAIHNSPRMVAQRHQMNALFGGTVKPQGDGAMPVEASPAQREGKPNNTGLPNQLKSGIESLSGMRLDHVKVHYNSDMPAQLNALAYAQGSDIHVAPGQEQHLPHEAWHIVQQAQGRVRPTMQMKDVVQVNDDEGLEREADLMGAKALGLGAVQMHAEGNVGKLDLTTATRNKTETPKIEINNSEPVQRALAVGGISRAPEWVAGLDWDELVPDEVMQARVRNIITGWLEIATLMPFANSKAMIAAAKARLAAHEDCAIDVTTFTATGLTDSNVEQLHALLGNETMELISENGAQDGLFSFFQIANLSGIELLQIAVDNNCRVLAGILNDNDVDQLADWATQLTIARFTSFLNGSKIAKLKTLCEGLGTAHASALNVQSAQRLMLQPLGWLQNLAGQWAQLQRLTNNEANIGNLVNFVLLCTWEETAQLASIVLSDGFFAINVLLRMRGNSTSAAILIAYLTEARRYGQTKAAAEAVITALPNQTLAQWVARLQLNVGAKLDLLGAEIEQLRANAIAVIVYQKTIQTVQESISGGGTHIFGITIGGIRRRNEIHVHYLPGQNPRAKYEVAHIKPSAHSETRHDISGALTLALIATVP